MWESNCNFPNNDYRSLSGISEMCGDVCASDATCTHWTWDGYNGGTCWLKKDTPSTKATSYGAICGYVVSRTATAATTSGLSTTDTADMLGQINTFRAQNGLGALTIDYRLVKAAALHSQDQASHCYMTHTGTTIANFGDRIQSPGLHLQRGGGHRANILDRDVVNVGFALATNGACSYKTYWTQDFGRVAY
ncbi:hypothetical protein PHYPSEUDO_008960 [Phytophthora pseudosyringae]|uniref:Apple domain-containing protein n=1 Tax=Phytophthora pseudosyringae TaxID=221518 RepID=A0A8T1WBB7_9STRA|nr:hypothetical protein PHYPSEUDO_008960 [Phytophthora pseudosyringae]